MRILALAALLITACHPTNSDAASAHQPTVRELETRLEATTRRCIMNNDERACSDHSAMEALWARGYCTVDAQGRIGHCTPSQIADDRRSQSELR